MIPAAVDGGENSTVWDGRDLSRTPVGRREGRRRSVAGRVRRVGQLRRCSYSPFRTRAEIFDDAVAVPGAAMIAPLPTTPRVSTSRASPTGNATAERKSTLRLYCSGVSRRQSDQVGPPLPSRFRGNAETRSSHQRRHVQFGPGRSGRVHVQAAGLHNLRSPVHSAAVERLPT